METDLEDYIPRDAALLPQILALLLRLAPLRYKPVGPADLGVPQEEGEYLREECSVPGGI